MAMFSYRSIRLLREKWRNVQQLAEEIYSIFNTEGTDVIRGSLDITPTDDTTPVAVHLPSDFPDGAPGFTISRGDTTISISPEGITITAGGVTTTLGGGGTDLTTIVGLENAPDEAPFAVMGQVVSGTGDTYQVELFADAQLAVSMGVVEVHQGQIDSDEQIPSGTVTPVLGYPVTAAGVTTAQYVMQVPVWL